MSTNTKKSNSTPSRQRILILHQNFPGQFRRIAAHLAAQPNIEVLGLGRETAPGLEGVKWLKYTLHRKVSKQTHPYCRQMENAVLHGQAVARALLELKQQGFTPDVVLAHPGWGESLYVKEVFPKTRLIHLCEWYYKTESADVGFDPEFPDTLDIHLRITTWNALLLLNLHQCDHAISPTQWQKSQHPAIYHPRIEVIHEGINTDSLMPDPKAQFTLPDGTVVSAGEPIITFVARNLEPYRGFHSFMRALAEIQKQHKTCRAIILGSDELSYGPGPVGAVNWREKLLSEVEIDPARTHFLGRVPYDAYRKVLQVSAAHVYLTYPFVLSWSMIEAMASGCLVIGSNTAPVQEVIRHGKNGLMVDFFDYAGIAKQVIEVLNAPRKYQSMRKVARAEVAKYYGLQQGVKRYLSCLSLDDSSTCPEQGFEEVTQ